MLLAFQRLTDEVEAGSCSSAGAGDVAPLLQRALVVEEDEGAVDGGALGGVAGERVAVVEVLGGVGEIERAEGAASVAQREGVVGGIGDDGAARAVADTEPRVVSAAEDAVADAELALAELRASGPSRPAVSISSVRAASLRSRTSSRR